MPSVDGATENRLECDIDKSWDGINFCMKAIGGAAPNLFEDGTSVGRIELGYGPGIAFRAQELAAIAADYAKVDRARLLEAYAPEKMTRVYPKGMWSDDRDDNVEYLTACFDDLREFLQKAATRSLGAIVVYC